MVSFDTPFPYVVAVGIIILLALAVVFFSGAFMEEFKASSSRKQSARKPKTDWTHSEPIRPPRVQAPDARFPDTNREMDLLKSEHSKQVAALKAQISELKVRNDSLSEAYQNSRKELNDAKNSHAQSLKKSEDQAAQLREELKNQASVQGESKELHETIRSLRNELESLGIEKGKLMLTWTDQVSKLKAENEDLRTKLDASNRKLRDVEQGESKDKEELSRLTRELAVAAQKVESQSLATKRATSTAQSTLAEKNGEIDELRRSMATANAESTKLITMLQDQIVELQHAKAHLEKNAKELRESLLEDQAKSVAEVANLTCQLTERNQAAAGLQQEVENLKGQVREMSSMKAEPTESNARNDAASNDDTTGDDGILSGAHRRAKRI